MIKLFENQQSSGISQSFTVRPGEYILSVKGAFGGRVLTPEYRLPDGSWQAFVNSNAATQGCLLSGGYELISGKLGDASYNFSIPYQLDFRCTLTPIEGEEISTALINVNLIQKTNT